MKGQFRSDAEGMVPNKEAKLAISLKSINKEKDFLFSDESYYILQVHLLSQFFQMRKSTQVVQGWAEDGGGWFGEGISFRMENSQMAHKLARWALASETTGTMAAFSAAYQLFLTDVCRTISHSLIFSKTID